MSAIMDHAKAQNNNAQSFKHANWQLPIDAPQVDVL
jgi:hypothetical protein